jgi:hypothetical protein
MLNKENSVSIEIPASEMDKVLDALKTIDAVLKPYLVALTPTERQTLPKMSDKTTPFVEKCLEYAQTNPQFAPSYMNVGELLIDMKAISDLTKILRPIEQLNENLNDTTMLSGSEAYTAALTYYNSVKQAAKMNVPNAKTIYEDLVKRFEKPSKKKEKAA